MGNSFRGLEAALNIQNLSLGLTVFFLARILGILFFMNTIDHEEIIRAGKKIPAPEYNSLSCRFPYICGLLLTRKGFAVDPATGIVRYEAFKYLHNLLQMPAVACCSLPGDSCLCCADCKSLLHAGYSKGIWFAGFGTVFVVFSLFALPDTTIPPIIHPHMTCRAHLPWPTVPQAGIP